MIGAEGRTRGTIRRAVMGINGHVAAMATSVLVLALRIGVKFGGHGFYLSICLFERGSVEAEASCPSPPWFLKRYDSKGVKRWGSANDMKAKGLEVK